MMLSVPLSESACAARHARASTRYCAPACLCHGHRMLTRACLRVLGACSVRAEAIHHRPRRRLAATAVMHSRQEGPDEFVWSTRPRASDGVTGGDRGRTCPAMALVVNARIDLPLAWTNVAPASRLLRSACGRSCGAPLAASPPLLWVRSKNTADARARTLAASANVTLHYTVLR